jgi:uncharacterized membrane protein
MLGMGTEIFLIFAAVNWTNYRLRERTKSFWLIPVLGAVVCLAAIAALVWETLITHPTNVLVLGVMLGASALIAFSYRRANKSKYSKRKEVRKYFQQTSDYIHHYNIGDCISNPTHFRIHKFLLISISLGAQKIWLTKK